MRRLTSVAELTRTNPQTIALPPVLRGSGRSSDGFATASLHPESISTSLHAMPLPRNAKKINEPTEGWKSSSFPRSSVGMTSWTLRVRIPQRPDDAKRRGRHSRGRPLERVAPGSLALCRVVEKKRHPFGTNTKPGEPRLFIGPGSRCRFEPLIQPRVAFKPQAFPPRANEVSHA